MKKILFTLLVKASLFQHTSGQPANSGNPIYRNFPLVVGIQFQNIGMPFKKFTDVFANPGIRIGTEISLAGRQKQNWVQGLYLGWNQNKNVGNNLSVFTQSVYRPTIIGNLNTDFKLGIGFTRFLHPSNSFKQTADGKWVNEGTAGKTMLMIPIGLSIGYNGYHSGTYVSPFVSYELMAVTYYNQSVPVLPVSSLVVGTRIYMINQK